MQLFVLMRNWTADQAGFREPFAELGRTAGGDGTTNPAKGSKNDEDEAPNAGHLKTVSLTSDPTDAPSSSSAPTQSATLGSRNKLGSKRKPEPNAHVTVLLDYYAYNAARKWVKAWLNGHPHLALAFLLSPIFLIFVTPLLAALIGEKNVNFARIIPLESTSSMINDFPTSINDWMPIVLAAMSEEVHGAQNMAWTNATHAFHPFDLPAGQIFRDWIDEENVEEKDSRITVRSRAYTMRLDCTSNGLMEDERQNTLQSTFEVDKTRKNATVRFSDRGCAMRRTFPIPTESQPFFMDVWADDSCAAEGSPGRFTLMMAHCLEKKYYTPNEVKWLNDPWNGTFRSFLVSPHMNPRPDN
jgi:hypothetical protein